MGLILLFVGTTAGLGMDVILSPMAVGVTLVNLVPRRSKELFEMVRAFAMPIYVIFFVLVGARLDVHGMPPWLWAVVGVYIVGRTIGKIAGAYAGARAFGAPRVVRRYAGLGLFAQGGIAVGLSIMASQRLGGIQITDELALDDLIIFAVTASTLVVQVVGPPLIRLAGRLAGEVGRDVTEQDVIDSWRVEDALTERVDVIREHTPLTEVFHIFASNEHTVYPVVDRGDRLKGVIGLDDLKEVMVNQDTWRWVLAADVMTHAEDKVSRTTPLREAVDYMREVGIEEMPVTATETDETAAGILDERTVRIRVSEEVLRRRQPV